MPRSNPHPARLLDTTLPKGAIRVTGLGKAYRRYRHPRHWLKEKLTRRPCAESHWVLQSVSFALQPGDSLGIIGQNGAGKSTLLQLIAGTLTPTTGTIHYHGRIAALLELGSGFHPEFTGRENARLASALMGLSPEEIDDRLPEIFAFAEIGDAIDRPVKTYSSGMFVRLAFAVATAVDPDILIIDEALSVGDGAFARKSFNRILELKEKGATLLFCSHALYQVRELCQKALWLDRGAVVSFGPSSAVTTHYQDWLDQKAAASEPAASVPKSEPIATTQPLARILSTRLTIDDQDPSAIDAQSEASRLELTVTIGFDPTIPTPKLACLLHTADGKNLASFPAWESPALSNPEKNPITYRLTIDKLPLLPGTYSFSVFLLCERAIHIYDQATRIHPFRVSADKNRLGYVVIPHTWRLV
ncbi:ABC transporter ATP-binding protein [Hydrogenophilus thiooxidans]|uniref:ABC transporter ATP-binding protein n=1 Tax=Hydrogenophilus thiooxidans TaxID=2820326 RepID=UPI001C236EAE|nr:ABC transporter ATP-binding protein [Hydrogenophilus thiooxidans]